MTWGRGRWAAAIAAMLAASGCILVANDDPSKLGTTCQFSNSDTNPCGKCIATSCVVPLDACCGKSACASSLGHLDDCALGFDPPECQALAGPAPDLYACIVASCGSNETCPGVGGSGSGSGGGSGSGSSNGSSGGPQSTTDCIANASTGSCSCQPSTPGNGVACGATTVGEGAGLCCADFAWPESGSCTCTAFTCVSPNNDGYYMCGLGMPDIPYVTSCAGGCTDGMTYCNCSPGTNCSGTETAVAQCNATVLPGACGAMQPAQQSWAAACNR